MNTDEQELLALAERPLELIRDGSVVGLGTGHAATAFLQKLGERVRAGLRVRCVPTSEVSADEARRLGVPLTPLESVEAIDITVDGADEVDPQGNLIKGYGGALVREKIVAAASRRWIILVGPDKLVPILGTRGILPVEAVPFGVPFVSRRLTALGYAPQVRVTAGGQRFTTDNGNFILDCRVPPISEPVELEQSVLAIPGVVDTGLFLGMAPTVMVAGSS
jgi:ribose 5-phosphate isomerase A